MATNFERLRAPIKADPRRRARVEQLKQEIIAELIGHAADPSSAVRHDGPDGSDAVPVTTPTTSTAPQ